MIDGKMQDDATWKQCKVMVSLAEMLARKDPELAELYGFEHLKQGEPVANA
jgi:malyl-CoA/(S)-citramalyl-CoA lyase